MPSRPPLQFEDLEARQLMATSSTPAKRTIPASVAPPLVLEGTLKVNQPAAMVQQNLDGSWTKRTPLAGTLPGLGPVHGVWVDNVDAFGDQLNPSTLQLQNAKGSFDVSFAAAGLAKPHHNADGTTSFETSQRVRGGTGAFAHATESGTILASSGVKHSTIATKVLASS